MRRLGDHFYSFSLARNAQARGDVRVVRCAFRLALAIIHRVATTAKVIVALISWMKFGTRLCHDGARP
jgi:hypothetical protein